MAKRRRRSSIVDALNAFSSTYKMTRGVMQDRDMAAAADAKQTEDTGFTVEQGDQLDAIANAKDENGNPFYNVEATADGKYNVTPNKAVFDARGADAELTNSTAEIAPGKRYAFQGEMQDKPFTEAEQDRGRMMAMSGVFSKYGDPVKALEMRQKAGQVEMQGIQKQAAEQGLQLSNLQIEQAKRANAAGERQDAVTAGLTEAAQAQAKAAESSGDYANYQSNLAKVVSAGGVADAMKANPGNAGAAKIAGSQGIEAMVRANAGPGASESEIQQAIAAYKQSIGDAQANQHASSMKALYEHQGQIWNGVGGDPVKAAAAYKMAEAEGMPQVIESLKQGDVDGANKIWNSTGQGKGIITEVGKDKNGNLHAKVVDPFSGQTSTVNVSDMERQLMSLKDQLGMDKDQQLIDASKAGVKNDAARVGIARTEAAAGAAARAEAKAEKEAKADAAVAIATEYNGGKPLSAARIAAIRKGIISPVPDQKGDFSPVKDMMGNVTAMIDQKTGALHQLDPETGQFKAPVKVGGAQATAAATPKSKAEYDKLPPGTLYNDGKGNIKKKPD